MAGKRLSQPRNSVWLTPSRSRGRRGGESTAGAGNLDRDKIVAAAVRLLDTEGDAPFTMRRLAAELNVTPMSVYWYVENKEDLMELALDAVAGEIDLPMASQNDWRDDLRALATSWRRTMVARPWALRCYGEYLNIGPQSMRFSQCARSVVARSRLPEKQWAAALSAVFPYVYGFTLIESRWIEYAREAGLTANALFAEVTGRVADMPERETAGGLLQRRGDQTIKEMRDQDFDQALDWLIAGMCAGMAS